MPTDNSSEPSEPVATINTTEAVCVAAVPWSDNGVAKSAVRGQALQRLAYISVSFPNNCLTRIEFGQLGAAVSHRMRDKVLAVLTFKTDAEPSRAT